MYEKSLTVAWKGLKLKIWLKLIWLLPETWTDESLELKAHSFLWMVSRFFMKQQTHQISRVTSIRVENPLCVNNVSFNQKSMITSKSNCQGLTDFKEILGSESILILIRHWLVNLWD